MTLISDIRFTPCDPVGSLIGFVQFVYDGNMKIRDVGVHKSIDGKGYKLAYPKNKLSSPIAFPINKKTQQLIQDEINLHLKGQVTNDQETSRESNPIK